MGIEKWKVRARFEVDMSPEAVAARLRDVGQLYELMQSLRDVRFLSPDGKPINVPVVRDLPPASGPVPTPNDDPGPAD